MEKKTSKLSTSFFVFLWNAWCCLSLVGIWPRFIEHRLLSTSKLKLKIANLSPSLQGLKICQFSDLHLHAEVSDHFLNKISKRIEEFKPDLLLFTGDFLCFSLASQMERLEKFLQGLKASYGCYAVLGNHDYDRFVSVSSDGNYDILDPSVGSLKKIFSRLWKKTSLTKKVVDRVKNVSYHQQLDEMLKKTPFKLLKNQSEKVSIKNSFLNIVGLEEYILARCDPKKAFQTYDPDYPSLVLVHNPDAVPSLLDYPGNIILSGHTHGGQVNLPWLWKKFTLMENPELKSGLFNINNKWIYVNRGVGSVMQFRWFAKPELLFLTLEAET